MKKLLFIIPILLLLASCAAKKQIMEVPVETVRTEYIHDTRTDSVFVKDSIDRWIKGDTVFIYKERIKYKYLNKTDTIIKTDTIPSIVKVETIKEVEVNHIYWYQKLFIWLGAAALALILFYFLIRKIRI